MTREAAVSIQRLDEEAASNDKSREIAWFESRRWN